MTKPIPEEEQSRVQRKDRDDAVLKVLTEHREWIPPADAFPKLPKETIEPIRQAMIKAGWWEYGPGHLGRSRLPATCLRTSLRRLEKKQLLPMMRPQQGKKAAPTQKAAKKLTVYDVGIAGGKLTLTPEGSIDRVRLIIEAARTGLKARLLVDGTIEVMP